MNIKTMLLTALAVTLAAVGSSTAAPRAWSKGTGNYDDSMSHRPTAGVRRTYRAVAPRVIEEAPAPEAVATAPSTTRRFSYEPSTAKGPCCEAYVTRRPSDTARAAQAPSGARSTRRYSYEPGARTYSAPRRGPSWTNPNSLPKSDPRRYNF